MARLEAAGRAYVDIAVASPDLFALMFRPGELDGSHSGLAHASRRAFEHLVRHVRAAQDAGWQSQRDTRVLGGSVWSVVHGLASLWSQGAFSGAVPGASLDDAVSITLEMVLGDHKGDTR
jgi:hypothetical protein